VKQRLSLPELNDAVIGWIYNESYRNLWKVQWCDFDDLVQDGLVIALKCRERYPDVEPAHFTALVKTSFRNHIVDLQRKTNRDEIRVAELSEIEFVSEEQAFDQLVEPEYPDQEFARTLSELPEPIKAVLRLFLSEESLRKLRLPLRETLTDRETPARRLKRLAGWPEEKDFASELEKRLING
jgi:DNA-directed RNA polymerase specialized sigma24 family protein